MSRLYASTVLMAFMLSAQAEERWMTQPEMREAFAGRTLEGAYASGTTFTESYAADGNITYVDPRIRATGRWHISPQGFCTFYDGNPDMSGGCFLARKVSSNCYEFYLTESQDAGPLPNGQPRPYVAQGWYPEQPSTCTTLGVSYAP